MDGSVMTIPTLEIQLEEALEEGTPCEGPSHPTGQYGHDASAPAAWMLVPTCGHEFLTCDAWLRSADYESGGAEWWYFQCHRCQSETMGDEMTRIPLT